MDKSYFKNALSFSHELMKSKIKKGDTVVDATAGNGNDTVLLAKLVGENGKIYAFDIQDIAINLTKKNLSDKKLLNRTRLIYDGHENIKKYLTDKIDFAIFNLGYLPKGDHTIITKPKTTIKAIKYLLELLNPEGIIAIVSYWGHTGGSEEKIALEEYISTLDQKLYSVIKHTFINQKNNPPIFFGIKKS